jgi:hypothetical protein
MDDGRYSISPDALYVRLGSEAAPIVADMRREDAFGVDVDIASHSWHALTIRAVDDEFTVSLDGTRAITAFDKTLSRPGRIALRTKGDSVTRFDQIEIVPLP